ncbi:MAG: septum formation protein Maf [Planctomycetia bacterium]|nr:septum formation protein Maf [Planctomycetia bacterium]
MATLHRLILASSSLGRRALLTQAGYTFEVMPSHIDEHDGTGVTDPRKYVAELAWQKAEAISYQLSAVSQPTFPSPYRGEGLGVRGSSQVEAHPSPHLPLSTEQSAPSTLILAADSTVWHHGQIIGKPVDEADARRILGSLAGTTHELWTGVCLWRLEDGLQFCWQEKSDLYFRPLSADELEYLIQSKVWEGKAGGYGIESVGDPYLTVVTGTVSNVIGLPVESLTILLRQVAPDLIHQD